MAGEQDPKMQTLLSTPLLEPIDAHTVAATLSKPPFEAVPGLINSRWLPSPIRPRYVFRAGALNHLTIDGHQALVDLGIMTIFDLRSLKERTAEPDPDIDGIEARWQPSTLDTDTTAESQSQKQDPKKFSFTNMYLDMFSTHKAGFKAVLLHVRDHPDRPFLFHCTAGKDRTGVLAAVLLRLAGASPSVVDHDYALTRIGTEPAREFLMKKLFHGRPIDLEDPLLRSYAQIPLNAMTQTLAAMDESYGGLEEYLQGQMGLSDQDVLAIRKNLTAR